MKFQKGHPRYGGRKPSVKTQLKKFEERHPEAFDALMEVLYDSGLNGHSLDAQYVIDRIKGKPKQQTDITSDGEGIGTAIVVKLFEQMALKRKELIEDERRQINGAE